MKFTTQRTYITPYVADHIPDIMKMLKEPDSNKFIQPMLNQSDDFYREKLESNIKINEDNLMYWSAFHKDSGDFVGTLNLNKFNLTGQDQLGLHLSRNFWGQGYGYEICQPMIDYAFKNKELDQLHWVWEEGHLASEKLARKLGFEPFEEMMDGDCPLQIYRLKK